MSKELFEHLMKLSTDDIISELEMGEDGKEVLEEDFETPLSSHETALYFQRNGSLTLDELNALMNKKIEEMGADGNNSNNPSNM